MMRLTVVLLGQSFQAEGPMSEIVVALGAWSKIVIASTEAHIVASQMAVATQAQRGS